MICGIDLTVKNVPHIMMLHLGQILSMLLSTLDMSSNRQSLEPLRQNWVSFAWKFLFFFCHIWWRVAQYPIVGVAANCIGNSRGVNWLDPFIVFLASNGGIVFSMISKDLLIFLGVSDYIATWVIHLCDTKQCIVRWAWCCWFLGANDQRYFSLMIYLIVYLLLLRYVFN